MLFPSRVTLLVTQREQKNLELERGGKKKKKASDYPLNGFHSHPPLLLLYGHCFRCWQALKQAGEMTHMCCFIVRHASPVVKYVTVVPTRPCERSGLDPDEGLDQLEEEQNTHSKS